MDPGKFLLYAIIFGIIVIVIWVANYLNKKKFEQSRILSKKGPKVERFVDAGKSLRPDDVIRTRDDAKLKVIQWWERSGVKQGVCGVCNAAITNPEGYLLPVSLVVQSRQYIDRAVKPIMAFGMSREDAEKEIREQISSEKTPWLVCEECIGLFFEKPTEDSKVSHSKA